MTPDTKPQNLSPNEQQDLDNRLIAAASNGNTATVQTLLAHGADVHARNDHALRRAADTGHTETVKVLLAAGADIHAIDDQALRWAAEGGCTETVNLLLAHDADVHALDDGALRVAVDNGHTETVKALIASGADVHAEDDWALRLAAYCARRGRLGAALSGLQQPLGNSAGPGKAYLRPGCLARKKPSRDRGARHGSL